MERQIIYWITEKARGFQKNISFCFIDFAKVLDCVDDNKLWKILKEMGIPDHLTCLLRNMYAGQEQLEPGMEQWAGSKLGKEYNKAVYCYLIYSSFMQSTSYEMLDWMNQSWMGEISATSDIQMTPPLWHKVKRN